MLDGENHHWGAQLPAHHPLHQAKHQEPTPPPQLGSPTICHKKLCLFTLSKAEGDLQR